MAEYTLFVDNGIETRFEEFEAADVFAASKAERKLALTPLSFGQWVVLMAQALGVKEAVFTRTLGDWDYSSSEHEIRPVVEAQGWIDAAIAPHLPKALANEPVEH